MQNLFDNAEKYSRAADDRRIHVRMTQDAYGVAVSVRDHGPGIDSRVRRHLFEPFARAKHRNAPAGIGLGLTITRALVRAHRGRIVVEDAAPPLPSGAIFTVTFRA
jgi:signal transduction histidine kinase